MWTEQIISVGSVGVGWVGIYKGETSKFLFQRVLCVWLIIKLLPPAGEIGLLYAHFVLVIQKTKQKQKCPVGEQINEYRYGSNIARCRKKTDTIRSNQIKYMQLANKYRPLLTRSNQIIKCGFIWSYLVYLVVSLPWGTAILRLPHQSTCSRLSESNASAKFR